MTPDLDLDALTVLEQAATPGPWEVHDNRDGVYVLNVMEGDVVQDDEGRPADAALIAAMRNALPALINAAREGGEWATRHAEREGVWGWALIQRDNAIRERDAARAELADLRERVERVVEALEELTVPCNGPGCPGCTAGRLRAALTTGGDDD